MKKYSLILLLLLLAGTAVQGQNGRNRVEKAQDHAQIQADEAIIQRDRNEIRAFRNQRDLLGQALNKGDKGQVQAHHANLIAAMQREIEQSEAKTASARKEVRQSKGEVRSESREVNRDRRQGKPVQGRDDRADRRDDVRDLADDQSDLAEVRRRQARQKEILEDFRAVKVKEDPNAVRAIMAKVGLLDEFEQTMIADMGENWEELKEDRQELREDRKETREDRRQR